VGFDGLTAGAGAGSLCLSANNEVTYSAGAGCTGSSQRFKHDIVPLDASSSLDTALKLSPVSFVYNDDIGVKGPQVGLIAEQVQQVDSRLVATDASGTPFTVKYENLTAILAGAIQKLFSQLSTLAATVASFAESFTTRDLTFTRATGDEIDANTGKFKALCVTDPTGETCISRAQLDALLQQTGQSPAAAPTSPAPQSSPTPVATTSAETTDAATSSPAVTESAVSVIEPAPEPSPAAQ
jgi:Chaperone of endosialidase